MNNSQIIANRYWITSFEDDLIGRGGTGTVYQGIDTHTQQPVAIKQLNPDIVHDHQDIVIRFQREGEVLRRLNHPNIVQMLDVTEMKGQHYLVMEYVSGGSLRDLLKQEARLPVNRVISIGLELADALARAHHVKIIHRDLKPGNVLLAEDGTPRLTDFGLAHIDTDTRLTVAGTVMGTYAYLSPEAWSSDSLSPTTDIWAFGVMLYEMLAGQLPFTAARPAGLMMSILGDAPIDLQELRPDTPPKLVNLIHRMLEKDPNKRINSARLVAAELEAIDQGDGSVLDMVTPGVVKQVEELISTSTTTAIVVNNLPKPTTPFVGRAPEVTEIVRLIQEPNCRLLTLVGSGGMGKTRLALQTANTIIESKNGYSPYAQGIHFVSLAPLNQAALILPAIANTLGIKLTDGDDPKQRVFDFLRQKEMLIIMDNFEHIMDGVDIVGEIIEQAPYIKFMATSRESLNLHEEWLFEVAGMHYPTTNHIDDLDKYSALKLFNACASRVRSDFSLEEDLVHAIKICQLVEGMPLALELSASWLRMLTAEQIVEQINQNIDFLTTKARNMPARHRSVRAVFDYSWDTLNLQERQTLAQLSVFRGPFSADAASKVTQASLLTITDLVDKSLVRNNKAGFFDMHELLRQYSAGKLAQDANQQEATFARHANYYAEFLQQRLPALKGKELLSILPDIADTLDNIRAAWDWVINQQKFDLLVHSLVEPLFEYFVILTRYREGADLFQVAYEKIQSTTPSRDALHLDNHHIIQTHYAYFLSYINARHKAQKMFVESVDYFRTRPHMKKELAFSLKGWAISRLQFSSPRGEDLLLEESVSLYEEINDDWGLTLALRMLAATFFGSNKVGDLLNRALVVARRNGNPWLIARVLDDMRFNTPHFFDNEEQIQESLTLYEQIGDQRGIVSIYEQLFWIGLVHKQFDRAKMYMQKCLHISQKYGYSDLQLVYSERMLALARIEGNLKDVRYWNQALIAKADELGSKRWAIKVRQVSAMACLEMDDPAEARRLYEVCRQLLPQVKNPVGRAEALNALENLAIELQEFEQARLFCEESLPIFETIGEESGGGWSLRNLGRIAYKLEDFGTAQTYFTKANDLFKQTDRGWILALSMKDLAMVALRQNNIQQAMQYFMESWRSGLATTGPERNVIFILLFLEMVSMLKGKWEDEKLLLYVTAIGPSSYRLAVTLLIAEPHHHWVERLQEELIAEMPANVAARTLRESHTVGQVDLINEVNQWFAEQGYPI